MTRADSGFAPVDDPRWTAILDEVPHEVFHRPGYVALDAALVGGRAVAWTYREEGRVALVPFIERDVPRSEYTDLSSPYGYGGPIGTFGAQDDGFDERCRDALVSDLRDRGAVTAFIRLNPLAPHTVPAWTGAGHLVTHGSTVSIDVTASDEEFLAGLRRDHRRDIRRAERDGLKVSFDDWAVLPRFAEIYAETMARVDASAYYRFDLEYFERLRTVAGDDIHLATVTSNDDVIAATLLLESPAVIQYHLSGSRTDALSRQPSKLMIAETVRWARARGATVLHLGGGVGGADDTLFAFKAAFSPRRHAFSTLRIVAEPQAYAHLVQAVDPSADPTDVDGFFPAYRRGIGR